MQIYKKYYLDFLKKIEFILPLIITAVASFGFAITHTSVSIDDTQVEMYMDAGGESSLFRQGRFTLYLINKIFDVIHYRPFILDFIAVVLLCMSAILFCTIFKKISNDKLHPLCYTFFSCVFVSYPLMCEIFNFTGMSLITSLAYLFAGLSLLFIYEGFKTKKLYLIIFSIIFMTINISGYESCASVYLFLIFALLILEFLFNEEKTKKFIRVVLDFFKYLMPLVFGVVVESLLSKIILFLMYGITQNSRQGQIIWGTAPFFSILKNLIKNIFSNYIISAFYYLPFTIMVLSIIICFVMLIVKTIKCKNFTIGILFLGSIFTLFALPLVLGNLSAYRTCQVFAVFVAFIFMLLWHFTCSLKKSTVTSILKGVVAFSLVVVIVRQANDLNKWFYVDNLRSNEELNVIKNVGYQIEKNFDTQEKPVVFLNYPILSQNINQNICLDMKSLGGKLTKKTYELLDWEVPGYFQYTQSSVMNFFVWGNLELCEQTLEYFKMNGYYFTEPTAEMQNNAKAYVENEKIQHWPKEGSVFEMDDCIVVNF